MITNIPLAITLPLLAALFFALAVVTNHRRFDYAGKLMLCLMIVYMALHSGPYLWQVKKTMLVIQRAM